MQLIIANKLYSSWSMRPWLVMHAFAIPFDEVVIPLRQDDTKARILAYSPAGKVPVLVDGDVTVWESLAIIEYLADRYPDRGIWPADPAARAYARSASSEMHAGFQALRTRCPVNLGRRFAPRDRGDDIRENVARTEALWRELRQRFGQDGPFLFGAFCGADAMFAPVVTRLDTYSIDVGADTRAYMDAVLEHASYRQWLAGALAEPWYIASYETGEDTPVEIFHHPASQQ
ncbi:MAG: hypothetical protein RLZ98_2112 [Pseudomonadota bacterium]|jgi:glutathione S-transferase